MAIRVFIHTETTYRKEINAELLSVAHGKYNETTVLFHDEVK